MKSIEESEADESCLKTGCPLAVDPHLNCGCDEGPFEDWNSSLCGDDSLRKDCCEKIINLVEAWEV